MFLKSVTLRGFKSFADKTSLDFEPGVTVIVGPNGSGKSNIVDALTWVLGSSSPKSLRGGQMADVIFAGAPGRPALGRAVVTITIDNSSGALPIEFSEVTVSRAMFASGENEYAINGTPCRALDVQELLSDTGLGREHHTIVGQGQLDAILNARPEERRAFIEEAAGILKHRRRKERSLRKLAQMEAHMERLTDVVRELRRSLKPLERQAEAAVKHAELEARLREVRLVRGLRELDELTRRWDAEASAEADARAALAALESRLAETREAEAAVERTLAQLAPAAHRAAETHFALSTLVERYRGLAERIDERRRGLVEAVEEPVAGRDPQELRDRAARAREALARLEAEREEAHRALADAVAVREEAERARRAHEQEVVAEARRRREWRERQLRWEGEVSALRSALAQAASEEGRLDSQLSGVRARVAQLTRDREAVEAEIRRLDERSGPLAEQLAAAEERARRRQEAADAAVRAERELERRRASLEARADALRAASQEATEGASAVLAAAEAGNVHGIVGALADHVSVEDGMAAAVAAALGPLGDALVARDADAAAAAVTHVRERGSGRVLLLAADAAAADGEAAGAGGSAASPLDDELDALGARPLVDVLQAAPDVLVGLRRALAGVYVVDDLDTARTLADRFPDATFATLDGELVGARGWAGGSAAAASAVLSRAAAEQAEAELETVVADLAVASRRVADADRELAAARHEVDVAAAALAECESELTGAAERLGRLRKELEAGERELASLSAQAAELAREIGERRDRLAALEARGVEPAPPEPEGPDLEAERLDDALAAAREAEVQARLRLGTVQERAAEAARSAESLEAEAADVERRLAERERRRQQRLAAIARCEALAGVAAEGLAIAQRSLQRAAAERDRLDEARGERQRELGVLRARLRELDEELTALRDARHREDLARRDLQHALDSVRARLRDELGVDPDAQLEAFRRGDDSIAAADLRAASDDDLAEEEERLVRKVALLGRVNPLALEEFHALKERHEFLTGQLEDLRASRRDLLDVVAAVEDRIREVFAAAFADVAAQFERIFPRLFPGGEGRLVLTDPDDLLESGVEVEARPPGKRVKRLSLLSGGERSLTALAVLFAIFAARPSPFYVLDEVEAALDDVNLQRFLDVVREFRDTSQLIIITHQQRTMEVADCLYGVSMQGDGVSKVISQRLREVAPSG